MPEAGSAQDARNGRERVAYAVVGLGHIAQTAVLPAFAHARHATLAALVTGDPEKNEVLSRRYGVPAIGYDRYDDLLDSGAIDAVYVAVPNHLHREYAVRALERGVHVLCEKPMAVDLAECRAMRDACLRGGGKLMIAYRLHFDPTHLEAIRIAREELGELRVFASTFSFPVRAGNVRLLPTSQGGGPLYDIGIYCINAARYLFGTEPIEVSATAERPPDRRFAETDATVAVTLRFPTNQVASFVCSFDAQPSDELLLIGTEGRLRITPAYGYASPSVLEHVRADGQVVRRERPARDQFGPELDHLARCVLEDRDPAPGWREGMADIAVIQAALASIAAGGRAVPIEGPRPRHRPGEVERGDQRPPIDPPEPVSATAPIEETS